LAALLLLAAAAGCGAGKPRERSVAGKGVAAGKVFFVDMLDPSAQSYTIGRYENGSARPIGSVARQKCLGLAWPSATQTPNRTVFMYATQWSCVRKQWDSVGVYVSHDNGHSFQLGGTVMSGRRIGGLSSSFFVYDDGVFRGWVGDGFGQLHYLESHDGVHFRQVGGVKGHVVQLDFVARYRGRWLMFETYGVRGERMHVPTLRTFGNPRRAHYPEPVRIGTPRPTARTTLLGGVKASASTLPVASTSRFRRGDLVVVAFRRQWLGVDIGRVTARDTHTLTLSRPLRFPHKAGDRVAVADARKVAPSFVCVNGDGSWSGIFSVYEAVPQILYEATETFRAGSPRGPWRVDYSAPAAPTLPLRNGVPKRSVENPSPLLSSPDVTPCQ
jgi:hypothetical protein